MTVLDDPASVCRVAAEAAGKELNVTLIKADVGQRKLETVSAEGWESAKTSFEEASNDLQELWDKNGSHDK